VTDQWAKRDRLRCERAGLIHLLRTMPESEIGTRQNVGRLIRENTHRLRQLIVDKGMDPCTQPDCVVEGTVSEDAKQWFRSMQRGVGTRRNPAPSMSEIEIFRTTTN
jgi:hypothetical protein